MSTMATSSYSYLSSSSAAAAAASAGQNQNSHSSHQQQRHLPSSLSKHSSSSSSSPIIIGYAHDAKSGKAEQAILDGVNVIIWSFVHLDVIHDEESKTVIQLKQQQSRQLQEDEEDDDEDKEEEDNNTNGGHIEQQQPQDTLIGTIRTELDLEEIRIIRNKYEHIIHLAALGGWNGPHPPPHIMSGKEWCHIFLKFNQDNDHVFDGIDWDYEGNDDVTSPTAQFTLETLDIMADFSIEAKNHGLIVSMAPAESYLDSTIQPGSIDAQFSLSLHLPPRAWTSSSDASDEDREIVASNGFSHAGRQCYAYVIARAGIQTFDWISIQLYEAYSPFAHDVHRRKLDPVDALMMRIRSIAVESYTVTDLPLLPPSSFTSLEYAVHIPMSKLVLGIANGWADGLKFCKVDPSSMKAAHDAALEKYGTGFLGVMFWTIEEEGSTDDQRLTYLLHREFKKIERSSSSSSEL